MQHLDAKRNLNLNPSLLNVLRRKKDGCRVVALEGWKRMSRWSGGRKRWADGGHDGTDRPMAASVRAVTA